MMKKVVLWRRSGQAITGNEGLHLKSQKPVNIQSPLQHRFANKKIRLPNPGVLRNVEHLSLAKCLPPYVTQIYCPAYIFCQDGKWLKKLLKAHHCTSLQRPKKRRSFEKRLGSGLRICPEKIVIYNRCTPLLRYYRVESPSIMPGCCQD